MIFPLLLIWLDGKGKYCLKTNKTAQIKGAAKVFEILDLNSKRISEFRTLLYLITMSFT